MPGRFRIPPRLLLAPLLALTGLAVGRAGDGPRVTMLVLLAEPFLWAVALWAAYDAWTRHDRPMLWAITVGATLAAVAVRVPRPADTLVADPPAVSDRLRACARGINLPESTVRLVQWHLDLRTGPDAAAAILRSEPDVVVLVGLPPDEVTDAVAASLAGEVRRVDTPEGPVTFFTRGVFHQCGDDDAWSDAPVSGAASAFLFAAPSIGTTLPLLVARLPDPLSEPSWAARAATGRARLGSFAAGLESSLLVVLLDAVGPAASGRLDSVLRTALLVPVARPATWPARAGSLEWPFPLHPFDQVWAASGWRSGGLTTLRASGAERLGVAVRLEPAVTLTLPAQPTL